MDLRQAVQAHRGHFICEAIGDATRQAEFAFQHAAAAPEPVTVPDVPGLARFYSLFGQLHLYVEPGSEESAFHIAAPRDWPLLESRFFPWIEDALDEEDAEDAFPDWIANRLVIGEIPASGNFLLIATAGPDAGKVVEFEHDGFEFIEHAPDLCAFVEQMLSPDAATLTNMASHLRFIQPASEVQWWIQQMRDNRGAVIHTEA